MNKTYDEWKAAGRQVRRGEKASARNEVGVAVFSEKQTDPIPGRNRQRRAPVDTWIDQHLLDDDIPF